MTDTAQAVARRAQDDAGWVWSVSFEVTERVHQQLPAFASRPELVDASTASSADIVDHFLGMLAENLPHTRVEPGSKARLYVRLLVERRISAEDLAAAHRIGMRVFWTRWTELLREQTTPEEYADALTSSTRYIMAWADALTERVIALHNEERSLWNRDPEAIRHETIRALIEGQALERDRAERRLRYGLDRTHRCLVLWAATAGVDLRPERLGETVPELFATDPAPAIVTLPLGPAVAIWWSPTDPRGLRVPAAINPALRGALGAPADGTRGFRTSYWDAMHARRVAVLEEATAGSVTDYADVALRALGSADLEQADRFVASVLGELCDPAPVTRELATTLNAFLDHGSNLRATASALHVHHNTVANRIRRAEQLLPRPTVGNTAEVLMALELLAITDRTHGTEPREVGARLQPASATLPGPIGAS